MAERYDVVVVGGGPAGSAAARAAATEGGKVLMLELQAQIGGQVQSAAWVSPSLVPPRLRESVVSKVKGIRLHSPKEEVIASARGLIVDRRVFDKLLAADAAASGVEIWLSTPVRELSISDGVVRGVWVEVGTWREQVECEVVIDATGAGGEWSSLFLRKVLGLAWNRERTLFSNEYLMANASSDQNIDLFFTSYFAPLGDVWVYPFGKRFAMLGIRGVRIHPDAALDEFLGRRAPRRLDRATPVAAFRSQLPIEIPLGQACAGGIMAVGSAAAQTGIFSRGLPYALKCGELAGEVAIDAITDGDVTRERLGEYDRLWRAEFEAVLKAERLLHDSLAVAWDQKTDAMVGVLVGKPKLQRAFVDLLSGAEPNGALRRLLSNEEMKGVIGREASEKALAILRGR